LDWISNSLRVAQKGICKVIATPEEQILLLSILDHNAGRLSPAYKPKLDTTEKTFKLSFLVPMKALSQEDVGRFTTTSGCSVCGKKTASRCSGCFLVEYCGKGRRSSSVSLSSLNIIHSECQSRDWPTHKAMCKSLKGGTWSSVTLIQPSTALGLYTTHMNFRSSHINQASPSSHDEQAASRTLHKDNPFLIKIQRPLSSNNTPTGMMVYDRQRSFTCYMTFKDNREAYQQAENVMGERLKIYRWAKWVDGGKMSICLDREPASIPPW
jgi:hypothetical protein